MPKLLEALAVMAEVTGTDWSKPTVQFIEHELAAYPEKDAIIAIRRCMTELKHKVTLADILDRMPSQHPGVEQAWGMVSRVMNNEHVSICWTTQMREAYGASAPLAADMVAARMAFKESYSRLISEARASRQLPSWSVSLGYDVLMREECVREAAQKNLISQVTAAKLLAYDPPTDEAKQLLIGLQVTL